MTSQQPFMNNYPVRQQQQPQPQQQQNHNNHLPPPPQHHHPPSSTVIEDDAIAAADKEMEERANRAKELLSQRYDAIRKNQVSIAMFGNTLALNVFIRLMRFLFLLDNNRKQNIIARHCWNDR